MRGQVEAKEKECAELQKRLELVETAARELLGDAGAEVSDGATHILAVKLKGTASLIAPRSLLAAHCAVLPSMQQTIYN